MISHKKGLSYRSPDELNLLGQHFNDMAEKTLSNSLSQQSSRFAILSRMNGFLLF